MQRELDVQARVAELVPASLLAAELRALAKHLAAAVRGIGSQLADRLAGRPATEVRALLDEWSGPFVCETLESFAAGGGGGKERKKKGR